MMEQANAAPRRSRTRGILLAASGLVLALAGSLFVAQPPVAADAAIAGSTPLLDVPQGKLTTEAPGCSAGDYCLTYSLWLTDARIFQMQAVNPTARINVALYDSLGGKVEGFSLYSGESGWATVNVRADGVARPGMTTVTAPGAHTLVVSANTQLFFSLFAFEIPDSYTKVSTSSTTHGEFNDRSTQRISGKHTSYRDGVVFDATKGTKVTVTLTKPGETDATVAIYDAFGNQVVSDSGGDTAVVTDFAIPYSGMYQVYVQSSTQGKFTLRVAQYAKVTKVQSSKKSVTLRLNKKAKKSIKLKAVVTPTNATNKKLTWASSNSRVARVSKSGKVTAVRPGKATITVTSQDSGKRAKVKVVVKKR